MNFLEFCKVSVIFWILNLNKLLNIPVCFYPRTLTCGVVDWVSCHDGNDQSTATSGPHTPRRLRRRRAGERRRRRSGHPASTRSIPNESPRHTEHDSENAATKRSPELAPASVSAAVNSGDEAIGRYKSIQEEIEGAGDAHD
jgi:hypothetical protein